MVLKRLEAVQNYLKSRTFFSRFFSRTQSLLLIDLVHNQIYNWTKMKRQRLKKANIHETKTHFSKYIEKVENGDIILICRRNVPVAELRPIAIAPKNERPIGLAKNKFKVPAEFFESLPKEVEDTFYQ